jgi:N-acetylglucosamine transport system substrate-binding protein
MDMKYLRFFKLISLTVAAMMLVTMAACASKDSEAISKDVTASTSTAAPSEAAAPKVYPENGLPTDKKVTLKWGVWHTIQDDKHYMDYVDQFTKKFPNVTIEVTASPTLGDIVKTKLAAGDDKDVFDIMAYGDWAGLSKEGKLQSLDDLYDRVPYDAKPGETRKYKDLLIDGVYDQISKSPDDGKRYYMPNGTYIAGLFYDKKFFEANGWNEDPKTWDEFVALLKSIKAKGVMPMVYAGQYGYDIFTFRPKQFELAAQNGNLDAYKNYRLRKLPFYDTPENRETWQREHDLAKEGLLDPNSVSMTHTQSQMAMIQHKAALVASGDWVQAEMQKNTPEGFEWGYMGIPFTNDPNQTLYIANGVNGPNILFKAGRDELTQKWGKEFLLFIQNINKDELKEFGGFSLRKDYYEDTTALSGQKGVQKNVMDYISKHKVAFVDMNGNDTNLTHPNAAKAAKLYASNGALVAAGKMEVEPFLSGLDKLLKEALDAEAAGK